VCVCEFGKGSENDLLSEAACGEDQAFC